MRTSSFRLSRRAAGPASEDGVLDCRRAPRESDEGNIIEVAREKILRQAYRQVSTSSLENAGQIPRRRRRPSSQPDGAGHALGGNTEGRAKREAGVVQLAAAANQSLHFHHAVQPAANHARAPPATAAPQSARPGGGAHASASAVCTAEAMGFKVRSATSQTMSTEEQSSVGLHLNPPSSACSDGACKSCKGAPVAKVDNSYKGDWRERQWARHDDSFGM